MIFFQNLQKKEGMEVIVPEEKDKIHLLESESIEKEENETKRDTLQGRTAGECSEFLKRSQIKKILEFQEILERLITPGASCQKRRRRQVAHSGCSHQETADGKKRSSCIFGGRRKKEKRSVECV